MKCGRETVGNEVFCVSCLADMARFPVKPDTTVVIPKREAPKPRVPQKKGPRPEEIIAQLKNSLRRLRIALAVVIFLLVLTAGALGYMVAQSMEDPALGSNYSTVTLPSEGGTR